MSLPIAMAGISAGLSVLGSIEGNKAITKAATAQYEANKLFIERDNAVIQNNLQMAGRDINNEVGMALTKLNFQGNSSLATIKAASAESNVYGNLAARKTGVLEMKQALEADSLMQAAEAKMTDLQVEMSNQKYATEAQHAQNMQNYSNQMSQRKSTLGIIAEGVSAGLSGYSAGTSLKSSMTSLELAEKQLAGLQTYSYSTK